MTVQTIAPTALPTSQRVYERHTLYHFITYRHISVWTRHSAATRHGVPTKNKSLTEMGGEEKEQRQEVRDQVSYSFSKQLHKAHYW